MSWLLNTAITKIIWNRLYKNKTNKCPKLITIQLFLYISWSSMPLKWLTFIVPICFTSLANSAQWGHIGSLKSKKVGVLMSSDLQISQIMSCPPPPKKNQLNFYQYALGPGCTPNVPCCVISSKALFPLATHTFVYHFIIYRREHFFVCWALLSHATLNNHPGCGVLWYREQRMLAQ